MSNRLKTIKNTKLLRVDEKPDEFIEYVGRKSYGGVCKPGKAGEFVRARVKEGHLSLGRHASASFEVSCSRACSHQLVRHAFISICQRSQRYCNEQDFDFVYPATIIQKEDDEAYRIFNRTMKEVRATYKKLLELGIPKEDARFLLSSSVKTELILTGNFQAWYDFLNLRLSKKAQWEIREIAEEIRDVLIEKSEFFYEFKLRKMAEENKKNYNFLGYESRVIDELIEEYNNIEMFHSFYSQIKSYFPDASIYTNYEQCGFLSDVIVEINIETNLPEKEVSAAIIKLKEWLDERSAYNVELQDNRIILNPIFVFDFQSEEQE